MNSEYAKVFGDWLVLIVCIGLPTALITIIACTIRNIFEKKNKKKREEELKQEWARYHANVERYKKEHPTSDESNQSNTNWSNCYQPEYLLSINEKNQFQKILKWAIEKNLLVFTKVRLLDLVSPRQQHKGNQKLLWKVQAKHVDFVICDTNINVKCIIEINDGSHNRPDRQERDHFVKQVLEGTGYKLIQTYNITEQQLNEAIGYYPVES